MTDAAATPRIPDATLYIATGCAYCPVVLTAASELVKAGLLSRLEIINIAADPERARGANVRSVPLLRLGPYELEGVRTRAELERYARGAGTHEGLAAWFADEFASGAIAKVLAAIHADDTRLAALLILLADPATPLAARVGVGAVMEDFAAHAALQRIVPQLGALARHADARVRTDAAHYLALSSAPQALAFLEPLLQDADVNVRAVAQESIERLSSKA